MQSKGKDFSGHAATAPDLEVDFLPLYPRIYYFYVPNIVIELTKGWHQLQSGILLEIL